VCVFVCEREPACVCVDVHACLFVFVCVCARVRAHVHGCECGSAGVHANMHLSTLLWKNYCALGVRNSIHTHPPIHTHTHTDTQAHIHTQAHTPQCTQPALEQSQCHITARTQRSQQRIQRRKQVATPTAAARRRQKKKKKKRHILTSSRRCGSRGASHGWGTAPLPPVRMCVAV